MGQVVNFSSIFSKNFGNFFLTKKNSNWNVSHKDKTLFSTPSPFWKYIKSDIRVTPCRVFVFVDIGFFLNYNSLLNKVVT